MERNFLGAILILQVQDVDFKHQLTDDPLMNQTFLLSDFWRTMSWWYFWKATGFKKYLVRVQSFYVTKNFWYLKYTLETHLKHIWNKKKEGRKEWRKEGRKEGRDVKLCLLLTWRVGVSLPNFFSLPFISSLYFSLYLSFTNRQKGNEWKHVVEWVMMILKERKDWGEQQV